MANQKQYPTFIDFRKGGEGQPAFGCVIANVTRNIELRHTQSGKAVANTAIAVNLGAKHLNYVLGTSFDEDQTVFIEVTGWEREATFMEKANITKGSQVAFTGTLALEEYQGKQRVRLNVSRFQVLRRKGDINAPANNTVDIPSDDLPF